MVQDDEYESAVAEVRESVRGCPAEVVAVAAKIVNNWGTGRVPVELFNLRFDREPSPLPELAPVVRAPPLAKRPRPEPKKPAAVVERPAKRKRSVLPVSINAPPARAEPKMPELIALDNVFDPKPPETPAPKFTPQPVENREVTYTVGPLQTMGKLCLDIDSLVEPGPRAPSVELQQVPHLTAAPVKRWLDIKGRRHVPKYLQDKRATTRSEYIEAVQRMVEGNKSCLTMSELYRLLGGDPPPPHLQR